MNICTIIAKNYVAHARVLADSFRAVHPDGTCTVLVIDDHNGFIDPAAEPFEILTIDRIGLPDPERMAASYDLMELSTAAKPWLLRHVLERPGTDSVTYLDPDIRVFSSLEEVDLRAQRHGGVLTPHFTAPLPRDGLRPSEEDILIAGSYNLGFIALGAGETAHSLLDWWSERLENHCLNDPERGHFVDQRWIDLTPGLWPEVDVLRDPGFNLAYWNLPTRRLEDDGSGYLVDGQPLRFFHFSGFDPRRPEELSRHQNRIDPSTIPALSRICSEYATELLDHGFEEASGWPYGWGSMANGVRLDRPARRLHREAVAAGAIDTSIFTRRGATRFAGYLSGTKNGAGAKGVNRYAKAIWDSRPDIHRAFPDIEGRDADSYLRWLHSTDTDTDVSLGLLPPAPAPEPPTVPLAAPVAASVANGAAPEPPLDRLRPGVNLVGYLSSSRGVGEAARQVLSAFQAGDVPTSAIDAPTDPEQMSRALTGLSPGKHPHDFNLLCVNADMLPGVASAVGAEFFDGRHSAGLWFWEVSQFPEKWRGAFENVDEVWVASEHVAEALRPLSPVPVRTVRLPITPVPPAKLNRAELGMPEGFCFLFVFDYRSVFRRKNPLGVVEAFCDAFEPGSGPSLVIKSVSGQEFPVERQILASAVRDRPEIHLIEDAVAPEAKNAMIAGCDCYVSLHRSEGLGLTMAEAMYFGRPVIATAYSGNLDFMTEENSFLVPCAMLEIGADAAPYPADALWAEPDLGHASALMRQAFEDSETAEERGRQAASDIRRTHSPEAAGEEMAAHVEEARRTRLLSRLGTPAYCDSDYLEHLLSLGEPPPRAGAGKAWASVKHFYMRLLRPYSFYQERVNGGIAASLNEVRAMLGEVLEIEAENARDRQEREEEMREGIGAVGNGLVETGEELRQLRDDVESTRDRDRGVVEALRASHETLSGDAQSAVRELRERVGAASELVRAANAKPYMSDDRLASKAHPLLGATFGFRSGPEQPGEGGYRGFEDLFRGPEEMIRERQRVYLELVAGFAPVFDAGCGRGEFLDLLAERGIEHQAVDLDPGMVERCHEKGHVTVEHGDLLDSLERAPAGSLGAIVSAQVIEHLELDQLRRFLELGRSRLRPGGLLIAETVNPHSVAALKAFWVDLTHTQPLFPETMLAHCQLAGYSAADVFAPVGSGDWEQDRTVAGEYAIVAVAPERNA